MAVANSIPRVSTKIPVTCPVCGTVNLRFPSQVADRAIYCNRACFWRSKHIHGQAKRNEKKPAEYAAWDSLKARCLNPNHVSYADYGGRGISIYPAWINDFEAFFQYVGKRPSASHSIDRWPNNDGNYEPGNVRWATRLEQNANKRNNRFLTHNGETHHLLEWSRLTGVKVTALHARLKSGWSLADALTKPVRPKSPSKRIQTALPNPKIGHISKT